MPFRTITLLSLLSILIGAPRLLARDWTQFMGDARRSGSASTLEFPTSFGCEGRVELGEAVLASPVVRDGVAYVVDQSAGVHAVELKSRRVLWSRATQSERAPSGNTSTPCLVGDLLWVATVAGQLHLIECSDGSLRQTIELRSPVVAPLLATKRGVLVSTLDSRLLAFGRDGTRRWVYDHYRLRRAVEAAYDPAADKGPKDQVHYSGGTAAALGDRIVAPFGYDLVCLEDRGASVAKHWSVRTPVHAVDVPWGVSLDDAHAYCAWPKSDAQGHVVRHSLADGSFDEKRDVLSQQWAVLQPPSLGEDRVAFSRHVFGVATHPKGAGFGQQRWRSFEPHVGGLTPAIAPPLLAGERTVFVTLDGRLQIWKESSEGAELVFSYLTPSGLPITSAPVFASGRILFGSDDGGLYVFGPEAATKRVEFAASRTAEPVRAQSGTSWPSAFGGPGNRCFVADASIRPPFDLAWAAKSFGFFKHPVIGSRGQLVYVSLGGFVVCREQINGRILWRRKLEGQAWSRASLLCADGKVFVPRVHSPRYPLVIDQPDKLYCLDQDSGELLWERRIGRSDWLRASPVFENGVVAYGSKYETPRGARDVLDPAGSWQMRVTGEAAVGWLQPGSRNEDWASGDPSAAFGRIARELAGDSSLRLHLRRRFILRDSDAEEEFGFVVGPHDELRIYIDGKLVLEQSGESGGSTRYTGTAGVYRPLPRSLSDGQHVLGIVMRRPRVRSNVSSRTSVFPPRFVRCPKGAATGPVIDAFVADTGRSLWHVAVEASGDYIEGPAGASQDGRFYFTGGGNGELRRGETLSIEAVSGRVLWRTDQAWACRTGTPAIHGGRLLLPGVLKLPMASLSLADGAVQWLTVADTQQTFVHNPSVGEGFFTVNNKYKGGAKRYELLSGEMCRLEDGSDVELAGRGHGCGSIVLLASGFAVLASNEGIYFSRSDNGEVVWRTAGFASQTCSHPGFAGGQLFYAPQNSGVLYAFRPRPATEQPK